MLKKIIFAVLAVLTVFVVVRLNGIDFVPLINNEGKTYAKAEVIQITKDNITEDGTRVGRQDVVLKILSGEHEGMEINASSSSAYLYGADCTVGMRVMAVISEHNGNYTASVAGYYRAYPIYVIITLLFLSLYIIGGRKGVLSILGLVFTFLMIFFVYLPMVYRGFSPFLAAAVSSGAATAVTFLLLGGKSRKTFVAAVGTVCGVVLSGIFAFVFCKITDISGLNVSEIDELMFIAANTSIKPSELLFSGILIASLGAVMDVAMTIASACEEIYRQNPSLSSKQLFESGMNVGRDAMGTMSNTLVLAFAGSSLNMIVTLYAYNYPYMYTINLLSVGIEVIKGVSGSMAIIYTVPTAAFLSSVIYKMPENNKNSKKDLTN